jgi:hypothetical protein
MKRRLLNLLTLLSLLLCVAVCVLWVRSYWVFDRVSATTVGKRHWGVYSAAGTLSMRRCWPWPEARPLRWAVSRPGDLVPRDHVSPDMPPLRMPADGWHVAFVDAYPVPVGDYDGPLGRGIDWRWWKIKGHSGPAAFHSWSITPQYVPDGTCERLSFPHWLLGATAAAPAIVLTAARLPFWLRARRRRAAGLCVRCGFDLRATPERCPECGRMATPP